jgi:hypothetical protein
MKIIIFHRGILLHAKVVALALFLFVSADYVVADSYSKFGVLRANITRYVSGHRWLVCYEPKRGIEKGELVKSEVVGFDNEGNIFRIRGDLRPGAENMLSLESYDKPSLAFSTKEGYFYVLNTGDGEKPFEYTMRLEEYGKLIEKFELYPFLEKSKDAPIKFELLKESPEFYNRALAMPRPESVFHLENPTARRFRVGMFLTGMSNSQCVVQGVVDNSAAAAAGIKPDDIIVKIAINGTNVGMAKCFPLSDDKSIRILSLKVMRKSDENRILFSDINVFLPSSLESFLLK